MRLIRPPFVDDCGAAAAGARRRDTGRRRLLAALGSGLTLGTLGALAPRALRAASDTIEVLRAWFEPSPENDAWMLASDIAVPLPAKLSEALKGGVPMYFVAEFELNRGRWYWLDERIAQSSQTYRLSYHALTRQYRVTLNGLAQHYGSLDEALRGLGTVRGWRVVEIDQLKPGTAYEAQVRMRLDTGQLPKPFQVTVLTNRDWTLQAEWKRFTFSPETARSGQ